MNPEEFVSLEPLYALACIFARSEPTMSISKMQRKFQIGYNRAARLCDRLADDGILEFNRTTGGWKRVCPHSVLTCAAGCKCLESDRITNGRTE